MEQWIQTPYKRSGSDSPKWHAHIKVFHIINDCLQWEIRNDHEFKLSVIHGLVVQRNTPCRTISVQSRTIFHLDQIWIEQYPTYSHQDDSPRPGFTAWELANFRWLFKCLKSFKLHSSNFPKRRINWYGVRISMVDLMHLNLAISISVWKRIIPNLPGGITFFGT